MYGQSKFTIFKQKLKSWLFKLFLLFVVTLSFVIYFLYSDFGNKNSLVYDFKAKVNNNIQESYDKKVDSLESAVRENLDLPKKSPL